MLDGVHADAVAEQRAAGALARGVDGDQANPDRIVLVEAEAAHELVSERGLAGAAGAGDSEYRHGDGCRGLEQRLLQGRCGAVFQDGDDPGQQAPVTRPETVQDLFGGRQAVRRDVEVGLLDEIVDHSLQTHVHAIFGGIDAADTISVQFPDLGRHDDPATTTKDLDLAAAIGLQQVQHVFEEFDVPALVGGDRDALDILLKSGIDDFLYRTVVSEVDHLGAGGLDYAAHDVDRRIVAVEQRGRGNETQLVLRLVGSKFLGNGKVGHGACLIEYVKGPSYYCAFLTWQLSGLTPIMQIQPK